MTTTNRRATAIASVPALFFFLLGAPHARGVEHPGTIGKDSDCTTCHAEKLRGRSVHSAMQSPCNVCHLAMTQGDMTTISLSMPKEKICSACHQEGAAFGAHTPSVKGSCVQCHDAHSSNQRMLLKTGDEPVGGGSGFRIAPTTVLRKSP